MALTIVMQDLITVSLDATSPAREVIQPEADWVDLGPYQDVGAVMYLSEQGFQSGANSSGTLYLETSPVREDAAFRAFPFTNLNANITPAYWSAGTPIAHLSSGTSTFFKWIRWRILGPTINGTATWTFRVVLTVNPAPR
jgi:hypothetical protein